MPRRLDADERERTIIAAAWRVIARDGVAALTVRNVAAEAGLAPSSLRYSFPTQASVRERALGAIARRFAERVDDIPAHLAGVDRARAVVLELLPLDAERRLEMEVFLALGMAALSDDTLRPHWIEADAGVKAACATALDLVADAPAPESLDHLHALVDGLALHLLVAGESADTGWALRVVDGALAAAAG